jgi:hypothetical protein
MEPTCPTETGNDFRGSHMKKTLSAAFVVATLALTSACGGGGDRPSKDEVKTAITKKDGAFGGAIPKGSVDCVVDSLVDSDLSDKTLNALVENDKDYKGSKADEKALTGVQKDITKCASDAAE